MVSRELSPVLCLIPLVLLMNACAGGEPDGSGPPGARSASVPGGGGSASDAPISAEVEEAISLAQRSFEGSDLEDMISLLRNAPRAADEEQRYQAYLGAWQLMRRAYHQQGRTSEQKAALDAVEGIARASRFYSQDSFKIDK